MQSAPIQNSRSAITNSLLWALISVLMSFSITTWAAPDNVPDNDIQQSALTLEEAKANLLKLDRDLSALEQDVLMPERTLILFGIPIGSQTAYQFARVTLDNNIRVTKPIAPIEITSMSQGGMMTLFDDNLPRGMHRLDIEVGLADGRSIKHTVSYNKQAETGKSILGIKVLERVPPGSPPIRVVEWPMKN